MAKKKKREKKEKEKYPQITGKEKLQCAFGKH